jgi:hypothetical protein
MPGKNQRKLKKNLNIRRLMSISRPLQQYHFQAFLIWWHSPLNRMLSFAYVFIDSNDQGLFHPSTPRPPGKKLETGSNSDSLCRRRFPFLYLISPFALAEGSGSHTTVRLDRIPKHVHECCHKNGDRTFCWQGL